MFVIFGATGNTGKATALDLLQQGHKVRAVVRNATKARDLEAKGAEIAIADIESGQGVSEALKNATAAYYLNPPRHDHQDPFALARRLSQNARHAFEAAKIHKVVALSSLGGQYAEGTGIVRTTHILEQAFKDAPFRTTILRPAYFLDNWQGSIAIAQGSGVFPSFLPLDLAIPTVDTRDIGAQAARLLLDENAPGLVELAGPKDLTPRQVAEALAQVLRKDIQPVAVPRDRWAGQISQWGASPAGVEAMVGLYDGIIEGRLDASEPAVMKRGRTSLSQTLTRFTLLTPASH